jgi:hypothetical protein
MTALITAPIAGAYTGVYNSLAIGILNDDGYVLSFVAKGQDINDTDQYGMTLIEGIYRGIDWRIRYRTKEWNTGVQAAFQIYGAAGTNPSPALGLGIIGRKYSAIALALVLTATTGTPSAATPATLTASLALLAPNSNVDWAFTSKVREVPIEHICLPQSLTTGGGTFTVPWTTT